MKQPTSLNIQVEDGKCENGSLKLLCICKGDETDWGGPRMGAEPVVLRTTLVVR